MSNDKRHEVDAAGTMETLMPPQSNASPPGRDVSSPQARGTVPDSDVVSLNPDENTLIALIGSEVGNYHVVSLLGRGGMGAVFKAQHSTLKRFAAIKVLLPQFSANSEIVKRFFNEAKAATAIDHPGIVEMFDFGSTNTGLAFMAMELLSGESLQARINRGALTEAKSLGLMRQMAGALAAAHAKGIIHRDLKPDNAFISPDPEVPGGERIKLLDFGIAKLTQDNVADASHTRTGSLMGTPTYMSPEQCRGVKVDLRSDIYALGCILFHMVAGQPPFAGEGAGDLLIAHVATPAPPLRAFVQGPTAGLEALVAKLLAKSPDDRPQSCAEVIAAIDRLLAGGVKDQLSSAASLADRPKPGHATDASQVAVAGAQSSSVVVPALDSGRGGEKVGKHNRWVLPLAIACAIAAGATAIVLIRNRSSSAEQLRESKQMASKSADRDRVVIDAGRNGSGAIPVVKTVTIEDKTDPGTALAPALTVEFASPQKGVEVYDGEKKLGVMPFKWQRPTDDPREYIYLVYRKPGHVQGGLPIARNVAGMLPQYIELRSESASPTKTKPPVEKKTSVTSDKPVVTKPDENATTNPYDNK
jgi:eukaryotic-like serine/threonine-protein kinase